MKSAFLLLASGLGLLCLSPLPAQPATLPDLSSVPPDLVVPNITQEAPAAGKRIRQTAAGWQGTGVHHLLYLPTDWTPAKSWPVIVEYAGNGGYRNQYGDVSDGTVEGSRLGYGITAGRGCIWLCLPFVETTDGSLRNAPLWWGDLEETRRYCLAAVKEVCQHQGGDPQKVVLAGFSRGSIACNYLGLQDDKIAQLWCGFICHSHYDGVKESWPYPAADRARALARLKRLRGRPQFISHEGSTTEIETWLHSTDIQGDWTFAPLPFRNHSDAWVLRDVPLRRQLRQWFQQLVQKNE